MRLDTILMVLGMVVTTAATYAILEITMPHQEPQVADVLPDEPPIVVPPSATARAEQPAATH